MCSKPVIFKKCGLISLTFVYTKIKIVPPKSPRVPRILPSHFSPPHSTPTPSPAKPICLPFPTIDLLILYYSLFEFFFLAIEWALCSSANPCAHHFHQTKFKITSSGQICLTSLHYQSYNSLYRLPLDSPVFNLEFVILLIFL